MQEVITADLAKKIRDYETALSAWRKARKIEVRGVTYATVLAVPLWIVSFLISSATGPVNQAAWLFWATFFSFIGALVASGAAIVLGGIMVAEVRPDRPSDEALDVTQVQSKV